MDKYLEETYKNTDTIIKENTSFFGKLSNIEEVFVLGHLISPVYINYFQTIFNTVSKISTWTVSYYNDDPKEMFTETLISIGVSADKINIIKLTES